MSNLKLKMLAFVPDLDEQTKAYCRGPVTEKNPWGAREGKFPYFREGYVNVDIPRDSAYTTDIRVASKHWAIADENGNVIEGAKFDSFADADKARAGAKISLNVDIALPSKEKE